MSWIPVAIIAYFLNAVAAVIDKILLKRRISKPISYTFYTGILSLGVVFLVPFGFTAMPLSHVAIALTAGVSLLVALYFFYSAMREYDASRVVPLVGAFSPVLTLLISWILLGDVLGRQELIAFIIFVTGGMILSVDLGTRKLVIRHRLLYLTFLTGLFFAITFSLTDLVFDLAPNFISGFVWLRFGSALGAILLFLVPSFRRTIGDSNKKLAMSSALAFTTNKAIGAVGFILFNYAIALGTASIVNSLKGLEHIFVFLIVTPCSAFFSREICESYKPSAIIQKLIGIGLIGFGILFLFI